jgi:hypothetical protein
VRKFDGHIEVHVNLEASGLMSCVPSRAAGTVIKEVKSLTAIGLSPCDPHKQLIVGVIPM